MIVTTFTDSYGQAWHLQQGIGDSLFEIKDCSQNYSIFINQITILGKENLCSHKAN